MIQPLRKFFAKTSEEWNVNMFKELQIWELKVHLPQFTSIRSGSRTQTIFQTTRIQNLSAALKNGELKSISLILEPY